MLLGYNTNGFAHHRLIPALHILADLGYQSVAVTLDNYALNPFDADIADQCVQVRQFLRQMKLRCVIETGARFLLDPTRKHQPTLLSSAAYEREQRLDFLRRSIEVADQLGADAVSFWSGTAIEPTTDEQGWSRLVDGCRRLCDVADR